MTGSEYILRVIDDIKATKQDRPNTSQGAFLRAALSILAEVDSPMKEQAFVQLATLPLRKANVPYQRGPARDVA